MKMMKYIYLLRNLLSKVFEPLRLNGGFFISMYLLGCLCQWVELSDSKDAKIYEFTYYELFFDLYLLCILLTVIPQKIRVWVKAVFYVLFYSIALVDVWCWVKFRSTLTPTMLMLVSETNTQEASEMLGTVLSFGTIFSKVGWILLLLFLHVVLTILPKFDKRLSSEKRTMYLLWKGKFFDYTQRIAPFMGLLCIYFFICSVINTFSNKCGIYDLMSSDTIGKVEHELTKKKAVLYEPAYRLVFSLRANALAAQQVDKLIEAEGKAQVDSCSFRSPTIVLIIGESYSKHHSQQYGYMIHNTPRQVRHEKSGLLVKFTDVVAPWNLTSYVFKNIFSMHVVGQEGEWCDYPLFPELFRKAGYHVTFLTNQFLPKVGEAVFDFSGGFFLNNPVLSKAQFDTRNEKTHVYDSGLLQDYDSIVANTNPQKRAENNLYIFHLIGQHVSYKARFPKDRKHIKPEDYEELRPGLTQKKYRMLSNYDNATLYNDSIVDQIIKRFENKNAIVIYMSDHGEEIYEGNRNIVCRNHSLTIDYDLARYEFEVPFWIYCSHQYAVKNPEIYQQIVRAKDRKLMTDALPHLLLYLAGISSPDYHAEYNVLSPDYQENRPRVLKGTTDYDKLKPKKNE